MAEIIPLAPRPAAPIRRSALGTPSSPTLSRHRRESGDLVPASTAPDPRFRGDDVPGEVGSSSEPAAVHLREPPHTAKLTLRGDPADRAFMAAIGRTLDLVLPTEPNTTTASRGIACLWLGPDEWLVTADPGREAALAASLEEALLNLHAAVTDVTDSWTLLELSGPRARDVLAKGCPLDLHPRAFAEGAVAQTLVAQADVILHRIEHGAGAAPEFHLYVRRSFAAHLWAWLVDAGLEYGIVRDT